MTNLTCSSLCELLVLKDIKQIYYCTNIAKKYNLRKRELRNKVKNKEYERLDDKTKNKMIIQSEKSEIKDFAKHPILIKNK